MLTTICTAIVFQSFTSQSVAFTALTALTGVVPIAIMQPQDQPGRRGPAPTQPANPPPTEVRDAMPAGSSPLVPPPEVRVIPLKYTTPDTMTQLINSAMRDTLVYSNERMNTVIYMGPPGLAQKVADMVEKIDVRAPKSTTEPTVLIQPLKHRRADDLARQMHSTFASQNLRIAADEGSSSIILSGSQKEINDAVAAIETLDQESPPAQLEFAFFSAESKKPDADTRESLPMPEDLKHIGEEIARFGHIEFQGRLTATAIQEKAFTVGGGIARRAIVEIEGKVIASPMDGPVKLEVLANMQLSDSSEKPGPNFKLRTTVTAKRGEFVVIGSAPAGWAAGDAVILVLHVQP